MKSTITSKGQITIPKNIRKRFGLKKGDEVMFVAEEHEIILLPKVDPLERLKELKAKIKFSEKELHDMMKESKEHWSKVK